VAAKTRLDLSRREKGALSAILSSFISDPREEVTETERVAMTILARIDARAAARVIAAKMLKGEA